jgi:hypothetical protein
MDRDLRRRLRTGLLAIATALATTAAGVAVGASPASAATGNNGACETDELCLWYDPNFGGSRLDFYYGTNGELSAPYTRFDDISHVNDRFKTAGRGQGQSVFNNAASARNYDPFVRVTLYSLKFCSGTPFVVDAGASVASLGGMQNNNESHCWD